MSRFFLGARYAIMVPSGEIDADVRTGGSKNSSTVMSLGSPMVFLSVSA
ncbi:Uncharacterised protein [Mycobacteroides abscessus subsp. abscessus]|nr:Uncharacterised protein [Mycobacteroides abscessus subsp. abscessus]